MSEERDAPAVLVPACPNGHGPLQLRPEAELTADEKWCGTWYECGWCSSAVLCPSAELVTFLEGAKKSNAREARHSG